MPVGRLKSRKLQTGTLPIALRPQTIITGASDEEGNTSECSRPATSSVYSTLESNPDNANFYKAHQTVISNQPVIVEHRRNSNADINCLDLELMKIDLNIVKDSSHN